LLSRIYQSACAEVTRVFWFFLSKKNFLLSGHEPFCEGSFSLSKSLIIGSGGGIGGALVEALRGTEHVVVLGRNTRPGFDLVDEGSIAKAAEALRGDGPFQRIVDATGALTIDGRGPEKRLAELDGEHLARAFAINAIGPALLLKHFYSLLPAAGRCVFATLSARVGSIGDNRLGGWYGYRASKAALNQIWRTAAIEIGRKRPEAILIALQPGTVRTRLSAPFTSAEQGFTPREAASRLVAVMDAAAESGQFLDHAGQIVPW
jgi:NAD(P)-dependent dehydrogenase (short-subunit alcohol dehydrogenase family)